MPKIFIGWDSRFPESADVLRHSLLQHASIPLDIRYLKLHELGLARVPDPRASTEFTYCRFLVPHLCGFTGKAIFMDSDMLCFADIKELASGSEPKHVTRDGRDVAFRPVAVEQSQYADFEASVEDGAHFELILR